MLTFLIIIYYKIIKIVQIDIFTEEFLKYWLTDSIEDNIVTYEKCPIWFKHGNDLTLKQPITVAMTMNLNILTFDNIFDPTTNLISSQSKKSSKNYSVNI